jgi:nucleoside-diphosphate-sugar epimerase
MQRIAVAGATGVLGRALVPLLLAAGYEVRALTPSTAKAADLAMAGAEVLECDLLAPSSVARLPDLVAGCAAVAHIATAIPRNSRAPGAWDVTTRLRTEGTRRLLDAALTAGVRRYIQQSIVMAYPDGGDQVLDEATPLDPSPARASTCGPVITMEGMIREMPPSRLAWCILRGGVFVGPGTFQDGIIARLRAGTEVVPCDGRSFVSLVHVADMAAAILAAVRHAPGGSTFNINADPLRQGAYLDELAARGGAPPPLRDPTRPCPPSFRCSNAAARATLHWAPEHGIWPS